MAEERVQMAVEEEAEEVEAVEEEFAHDWEPELLSSSSSASTALEFFNRDDMEDWLREVRVGPIEPAEMEERISRLLLPLEGPEEEPEAEDQGLDCGSSVCEVTSTPVDLGCRHCGARVSSQVVYHTGLLTWIICITLLFFFFPLAWIPFCLNRLKDAHHFCPNCSNCVGIWSPCLLEPMPAGQRPQRQVLKDGSGGARADGGGRGGGGGGVCTRLGAELLSSSSSASTALEFFNREDMEDWLREARVSPIEPAEMEERISRLLLALEGPEEEPEAEDQSLDSVDVAAGYRMNLRKKNAIHNGCIQN